MKKAISLVLLTLLATSAFAQRGGVRGPMPGGRGEPEAALKAALNLTDSQLAAINALNQTRMSRAEAIRMEIGTLREAFEALLEAAAPNTIQIGTAALAIHAAQKRLEAERDWYITELKKLLTPDQVTTLDNLLAANDKLPLLPHLGIGGRGGPRQ
jgi:Spy/CpxP family protein refolding chaperone